MVLVQNYNNGQNLFNEMVNTLCPLLALLLKIIIEPIFDDLSICNG